jgi:hypothetical protein
MKSILTNPSRISPKITRITTKASFSFFEN